MWELYPKYSPALATLSDGYGPGHSANYHLPVTGYRFCKYAIQPPPTHPL